MVPARVLEIAADRGLIRALSYKFYPRWPRVMRDDLIQAAALSILERGRRQPGAAYTRYSLIGYALRDAAVSEYVPELPMELDESELSVPPNQLDGERLRDRWESEQTEEQLREWMAAGQTEKWRRRQESDRALMLVPA